jgi:hypothetical protein
VLSVDPVAASNGRQFDITFAEQAEEGDYALVLGPEIYDTGANRMDQDRDGSQGEVPDDQYTARFTMDDSVGPDGYGYEAHVHSFENIDLVPGAPGVFTILDGVDDGCASVDLDVNTFTFYGGTYPIEGELWVSSNGLIAFRTEDNVYWNNDLSDYPTTRAIAPLWDDWRLDLDDVDQVLDKFVDADADGTPDRLIIEWNQVRHYSASPSDVTFQAILGLNSGPLGNDIPFMSKPWSVLCFG